MIELLTDKLEEIDTRIATKEHSFKQMLDAGYGHQVSIERLEIARLYIQKEVVLELIKEFEK